MTLDENVLVKFLFDWIMLLLDLQDSHEFLWWDGREGTEGRDGNEA